MQQNQKRKQTTTNLKVFLNHQPSAVLRASMLDYVKRSVQRSPSMMREPGDACNFLRQAGRSHKIPNLIPDVSLET